jgi:hypothetical protein
MAIYRFRVTFEEQHDIIRDIEIKPNQTFKAFHDTLQQSIGFDDSKDASYFMSNDNWKKGQEISNREIQNGNSNIVKLEDAVLSNFIADPHQKIYHEFGKDWTFLIELKKIVAESIDTDYPRCSNSIGIAPKQYIVIEPPKGTKTSKDQLEEDILMIDEVDEPEEETDEPDEDNFQNVVDEKEYDNIEDRSEENS